MELSARCAYRGQVTKIVKAASEYLCKEESRLTNEAMFNDIEEELAAFIQRLTAAHESLMTTNQEVRTKGLIRAEEYEKDVEKTAEYEDSAIGMLARLKSRLKKLQLKQSSTNLGVNDTVNNASMTSATANNSFNHSVKLPKLPLKRFDGNYQEWLPFWEQFRTAVHENSSLTATDKFSYLESVLVGKAKKIIAGFTASKMCYDAAIALLQEQFGDTEQLVDKHMQQLISLRPVMSRTDVNGLRNLYNSVSTCSRTLTALQIPSHQYCVMLKSILLRCFPVDLRVDYYRSAEKDNNHGQTSNENASYITAERDHGADDMSESSSVSHIGDIQIKSIMSFLKREVESLERSRVISVAAHAKSVNETTTATSLVSLNEKDIKCFFCESDRHATKDCDSDMSLTDKREKLRKGGRCFRCAKRGHSAKKCRSAQWISCKKCKGKHLSTMCDPSFTRKTLEAAASDDNIGENALNLCAYDSHQQNTNVFLKTARGIAVAPSLNKNLLVRLIIDGGSQYSYICESLVKKLGLPSTGSVNISVLPFGSKHPSPCQKMKKVKLNIKSQFDGKCVGIEAIVVPNICVDVLPVPDSYCVEFEGMSLADSQHVSLESEDGLSILIGSDNYWSVVTGKQRRLSASLRAVDTILGWTLQGLCSSNGKTIITHANLCSSLHCTARIEDEISTFWSLEAIGIQSEEAEKNSEAEHLASTCITKKGARYETCLPWKDSNAIVGNNKHSVLNCLRSLVKRLSRNPSQFAEYDAAIKQMILDGIAEPVKPNRKGQDSEIARVFYLPHRPVYRAESTTTKMRIVFNASFRTEEVPSLNEQLHVGANLLPDVLTVLLNFRLRKYGIVADVEKAFLQILLNEKDRDSHRFIWISKGKSSDGAPAFQEYRMTRLTFGVNCSPFILMATIRKHLSLEEGNFPMTCKLLRNGFYVDDFVASVDTSDEGKRTYSEAVSIMNRAGMSLRKWNSNDPALRKDFGTDCPAKQKILGLDWFVHTDEIAVSMQQVESLVTSNLSGVNKRVVLQTIARIYDPLGIYGPVVVKLKILFQSIWRSKLSWEQILSTELMSEWNSCIESLLQLKDYTFPRAALTSSKHKVTIHIFADASMKAYGTVAYIKYHQASGAIETSLLCAKSRVAPLKQDGTKELTLPKLELTAALIAARLCSYLKRSLKIPVHQFYLWTDSKITLNWIQGEVDKWKPYVQSRVAEIRRLTAVSDWNHCAGKDNPADLLTRGVTAETLKSSCLWAQGPVWLKGSNNVDIPLSSELSSELETVVSLMLPTETSDSACETMEPVLCFQRFDTWERLLRLTAGIMRFIKSCRRKARPDSNCLSAEELNAAETYWLRYIQLKKFNNEICLLQKEKLIPKSSKIWQLSPFLDKDGLLRLRGRLQALDESADFKHPIILPRNSYITWLIVKDYHQRTLHGGVNLVLAQLRERFWILQGRPMIKQIVKQCVVCQKLWGKPASQPFGPVPIERLSLTRPFESVGVDFAGPLYCFDHSSGEMKKAYLVIFTCATIRAVHLELVTNMTTESCLMSLRRFIARRGIPSVIFSDNAKTFRRAALELEGITLEEEALQNFLAKRRIRWKFIVERAPWWGGFWERLIRSIKNVLKVVIGKAKLTREQLETILVEAEAMVNARPLTYISSDPGDIDPLTPAKFLLGQPSSSNMCGGVADSSEIQQLWKQRVRYTAMLWTRWRLEYMQLLRSFHHSDGVSSGQLKPNDVVLVFDSGKPRINWKMAKIEVAHNGRDGKIRACEIRYADGTRTRRPVQLLYPLELSQTSPAGGC